MESTRRALPGIFQERLSARMSSRSPQKKRATMSLKAEAEEWSQGPAEGEAFLEPQDFKLEGRCR